MTNLSVRTAQEIDEIVDAIAIERTLLEEQTMRSGEAVLAVLARAAYDRNFLRRMADDPHEALEEYYTLTPEEKAALASGDIAQIESWVGKLDEPLATWLWCRLSQEKW